MKIGDPVAFARMLREAMIRKRDEPFGVTQFMYRGEPVLYDPLRQAWTDREGVTVFPAMQHATAETRIETPSFDWVTQWIR